jgi:hypothetical protein
MMNANKLTSLLLALDLNLRPVLAGEDRRNLEAGDPRLNRVKLLVEKEIDHRRVVDTPSRRPACTAQHALLRPARAANRDELVELRIVVERDVSADTLVAL